ncbi:MAG: hypothetical protein AAFO07_32020 [Bacteroidota bacterium]
MSTLEIRPRFEIDASISQQELLSRFKKALKSENISFNGYVSDRHIVVKIPPNEDHFWSPQLSMDVVEKEDSFSTLYGLIGPKPSVWLMFVFFYFFLGFFLMIISIIGFSRMNLGLSAGILWLLPIVILLIVAVYVTAYLGRKLGRDQMKDLLQFVNQISET